MANFRLTTCFYSFFYFCLIFYIIRVILINIVVYYGGRFNLNILWFVKRLNRIKSLFDLTLRSISNFLLYTSLIFGLCERIIIRIYYWSIIWGELFWRWELKLIRGCFWNRCVKKLRRFRRIYITKLFLFRCHILILIFLVFYEALSKHERRLLLQLNTFVFNFFLYIFKV